MGVSDLPGFGYHFDPSDAIILQVEGNKCLGCALGHGWPSLRLSWGQDHGSSTFVTPCPCGEVCVAESLSEVMSPM